MIRVLMISETWPPTLGGGAVHAFELCARLRKRGCRVTVIKGRGSENFLIRCWFVVLATIQGLFVPADLIHAHAFLGTIPGKILSIFRRLPVVLTVHGTRIHIDDDMGHGFIDRLYRWLEKKILLEMMYDTQISVDNKFLSLPNVNEKIFVIPNGVDVRSFDSVNAKKEQPPAILFVGRLHKQKGLTYLIKAFAQLREKIDTQLWVVGDGPLRSPLMNRVKVEGIGDVTFFGAVHGEKLIRLYKEASVFVLPSLYEGSPLTLFEAWAAKLPVVVTDVGDNADVVSNGKNGYVVPAKDVKALTRTLTLALTSGRAGSLGLRGYTLVKARYSWEKAASSTLSVYKEVLRAKS